MNIKSVDYILTAKHMSPDGTARGYYLHHAAVVTATRGARLDNLDLDHPSGTPIWARVYQGQWIADCECAGASFVDPDFPVFFCFSCGNRANDGRVRPVLFPPDRAQIEAALLERPVDDLRGLTDAERAVLAQPLIHVMGKGGLARNWLPGETLDDLHAQQDDPIRKWRKALKEGK
jgi:hypothetical protein